MICQFCGYEFDDNCGKYGCPNCNGEGLDDIKTTNQKGIQIMLKQRTIKNMTNTANCRARALWEIMQTTTKNSIHDRARDTYHAMFKNDRNFVDGTEPYSAD